jgi:alcohol dehydrogenase
MQSLTFVEAHRLEWRDQPEPRLQDDHDVVVRPLAASICDIDRPIIDGSSPFGGPFAIGHEGIGEVVSAGDAIVTVSPGDLVIVPWHIACGDCDRCRRGLTAHCQSVPSQAMYGIPSGGAWGGLFDDLLRVPYADRMLVRIPRAIDPLSVVSAGDNLTLGLEIMGPHLRSEPGLRILVLGSGAVGLYQVQVARALGTGTIVYVDEDSRRLGLAASLGAVALTGPPAREMGRFGLVVDASFNKSWLARGARMLEHEGTLECLGGYFEDVPLPVFAMYATGVRFRVGRSNLRPHIEGMLDLVGTAVIDPKAIQTEVLDWDLAPEVLAYPPLKPVFCRFGSATAKPPSPPLGEGALPGRAPGSFGPKIFRRTRWVSRPGRRPFPDLDRAATVA